MDESVQKEIEKEIKKLEPKREQWVWYYFDNHCYELPFCTQCRRIPSLSAEACKQRHENELDSGHPKEIHRL